MNEQELCEGVQKLVEAAIDSGMNPKNIAASITTGSSLAIVAAARAGKIVIHSTERPS